MKRIVPSQQDAQLMIDWLNALDQVTVTNSELSKEYKDAWKKASKIRLDLWKITFGNKSPWNAEKKIYRNREEWFLEWDEHKAYLLGV